MNISPSDLKPCCISVFIVKETDSGLRYLMLHRIKKLHYGMWQPVTGSIEEGETAVEAALRELNEETGLRPLRFYNADYVETFYAADNDCVVFVPVFLAIVEEGKEVQIDPREHDLFAWSTYEEALSLIEFRTVKSALTHINTSLIEGTLSDRLLLQHEANTATV